MHPGIVKYHCPTCPNGHIVEECVDIVSDDLLHDANSVHKFLEYIFDHLKNIGVSIEKAYILSDGCAAQYKSRTTFLDCSLSVIDFGFPIERAYYGSRHGKNRCDGEGGVLKEHVRRGIKNTTVEVNTAADFYQYLKLTKEIPTTNNDICNWKRRSILWVPKSEIDHNRHQKYPVKTVPGTRQLHSVFGISAGHIQSRKLSCFCSSCLSRSVGCKNEDYVESWSDVTLLPLLGESFNFPTFNDDEFDKLMEVQLDTSMDIQLNTSVIEALAVEETLDEAEGIYSQIIPERSTYVAGEFVVVKLRVGSRISNRYKEYAAEIKEVMHNGDLCLQYLEEVSEGLYKWPIQTDLSVESADSVLKKLPFPFLVATMSSTRCQYYSFK